VTDAERRQRLAMADDETVARVRTMMILNNTVGVTAALRGRAARRDYRESLPKLRVPSFVCSGTADPWSTPEVTREVVEHLRTAWESRA